MSATTLHQLHLPQNTTLVYYISFTEGTYQRFILVLHFDTPDIFFVAIFILEFLGVSSDNKDLLFAAINRLNNTQQLIVKI